MVNNVRSTTFRTNFQHAKHLKLESTIITLLFFEIALANKPLVKSKIRRGDTFKEHNIN